MTPDDTLRGRNLHLRPPSDPTRQKAEEKLRERIEICGIR